MLPRGFEPATLNSLWPDYGPLGFHYGPLWPDYGPLWPDYGLTKDHYGLTMDHFHYGPLGFQGRT